VATLFRLQPLEGQIVLSAPVEGWRVAETNGDHALADKTSFDAGTYEARVRATTARPGAGMQIAQEVYVAAHSDGSLLAVPTTSPEVDFVPTTT
jgi:hypothetical protein